MKFLWTTFMINDLDGTLAFFKDVAGIEPVRRFQAGPEKEIAFLCEGETKIELVADKGIPSHVYKGVSVGLAVDDLDQKKKELEDKGYETSPVISPNPATRFFFVADPNGIGLQFVEEK